MPINAPNLLHILEKQQVLTRQQAQLVAEKSDLAQLPLLHYLVNEKILTGQVIANACATYFNLTVTDLKNYSETSSLLAHPLFDQYLFIPILHTDQSVTIAISHPDHLFLAEDLKFQLNTKIQIVFAAYDQFIAKANILISQKIYARLMQKSLADQSIIHLAQQLLTDAVYRDASDIHGEPMQQHYRVRMRIDGLLHEVIRFPIALASALTSRFKIMAGLDIAEKRLPQDGRFSFVTQTQIHRQCRISTCPTLSDEKIVIRLLNPMKNLLSIDNLGLEIHQKKILLKAIQEPQGLILITGPTGSGKTITLYTLLQALNTVEKNISTIEDPIEIHLPGINQVNVNPKAGLNFATTLRAFLRQDPDILMVGEIRDFETAEMAIRAAHTGHLVLSTLHTNSAPEALTRLINLGIEPFNLAGTLLLIVAQRLVRTLCVYCENQGDCLHCSKGYKGRMGIFEIMTLSTALRELMAANATIPDILRATSKDFQNLWQSGKNKVQSGLTTHEELQRVLSTEIY